MIIFGSFLPSLWLVCATKVYSGLGADMVMESLQCWPHPWPADRMRPVRRPGPSDRKELVGQVFAVELACFSAVIREGGKPPPTGSGLGLPGDSAPPHHGRKNSWRRGRTGSRS